MRSRVWNLHLNLDKFNSECAGLSDDHEMADFLRGFIRGVNAGSHKVSSDNFQDGFNLGKEMRDEVDDLRKKAVEDGLKGGPKKWKPRDPSSPPNTIPTTTPNSPPEPTPTPTLTGGVLPNPLILLSINPETTTTDKPPVVAQPKRQKRRTRDEILSGYPDRVREVTNHASENWPESDPDGREITISYSELVANIDLIFKEHPEATAETLKTCVDNYLKEKKFRYCAPQHFFGKGKPGGEPPHWVKQYRFISHMAERLLVTE